MRRSFMRARSVVVDFTSMSVPGPGVSFGTDYYQFSLIAQTKLGMV
jgi:hypothetical protein